MPDPIVPTTSGPVRGSSDGQVQTFRGIRYAASPAGPGRWRAPVEPEPWREPAAATAFAPAAVQPHNPAISFPVGQEFSEDCLFLNVWAPAQAHGLPVMVWIHGGAYVFGGTAQHFFDGHAFAATGRVVLVTVGYRLGALGFADFSALAADLVANPALHDVLAALRWVQRNIAAFGGDPGAVTVFGESAGGGIVTTLLTMPAAAGLFSRAIAESSPATSVYGQARAARIARRLADRVGAPDIDALRSVPAHTLTAAAAELFAAVPTEEPGTLAFAPVVDGEVVPEHPVAAFAAGRAQAVPLLLGTNADETSLFTHMRSPLMPVSAEALAAMTADLREENPDLQIPVDACIDAAYAGLPGHARGPAESRDLAFRMPAVWIAEGHAALGPTYLYRFDWTTPMLRLLGIGATHGTEIPYVWGNLVGGPKDITFRLGGRHRGRAVAARLQERWIAFAETGVPDAPGAPAWPAYVSPERASLVIDRSDEVVHDLDAEGRRLWGAEPLWFP